MDKENAKKRIEQNSQSKVTLVTVFLLFMRGFMRLNTKYVENSINNDKSKFLYLFMKVEKLKWSNLNSRMHENREKLNQNKSPFIIIYARFHEIKKSNNKIKTKWLYIGKKSSKT